LPGAWVWCEEEGGVGFGEVANYHGALPPLKLIKLIIFWETTTGTTNHCKRALEFMKNVGNTETVSN